MEILSINLEEMIKDLTYYSIKNYKEKIYILTEFNHFLF